MLFRRGRITYRLLRADPSQSWLTAEGRGDRPTVKPELLPESEPPAPPGEMLLEEFIKPLGMTQTELADRMGVSFVRLNEIVNGRRGITPSTALRLAKALGTTPQSWLNGQLALDLYRASHDEDEIRQLERIEPVSR
jgi:addiction module HigA family antidote